MPNDARILDDIEETVQVLSYFEPGNMQSRLNNNTDTGWTVIQGLLDNPTIRQSPQLLEILKEKEMERKVINYQDSFQRNNVATMRRAGEEIVPLN